MDTSSKRVRPTASKRIEVYSLLAAILFLVLVIIFNGAAEVRALGVVLLVPLLSDIQRRLANRAVRRYVEELLGHAEWATGEKYS